MITSRKEGNMSTTLTYSERYAYIEDNGMPYTQEKTESELLGKLLCASETIQRDIIEHITPQMFTVPIYRKIFMIILDYVKTNGFKGLSVQGLDYFYFGEDNKIVDIETIGTLFELESENINWSNYQNFVMWLQDGYYKRTFKECHDMESALILKDEYEKLKFKDNNSDLNGAYFDYLDNYDKTACSMVKTYYHSIDTLIGGFQGGELIILAGATSMGKTAVAVNFIIKMLEHGKKCLFVEYEMTQAELLQRLIANKLSINHENIRNRTQSDEEMLKFVNYGESEQFKNLNKNLTIPATAPKNISQLESYVKKSDADIVFIDHLGLIKSDLKGTRYEQITDISRRLKLLAMDINKPIIALCQLSRTVKDNRDNKPTLSNLRDSGAIEQDANTILFVYRPAYYDFNADKTALEIICAKSRSTGGAGKIAQLKFNGQYQRITDPMGETTKEYKQCGMMY